MQRGNADTKTGVIYTLRETAMWGGSKREVIGKQQREASSGIHPVDTLILELQLSELWDNTIFV